MTVYTPSFVAANSSTVIPNFTTRTGNMGITTNRAYPSGAVVISAASFNTTMNSDDMEVSITLGATSGVGSTDNTYLWLGANTSGEAMVLHITSSVNVIASVTGWPQVGSVSRAAVNWVGITTGDTFTFRRVGNVYSALKNGAFVTSFTDASNVVPRDSAHRLVAMGGFQNSGSYRTIASLTAADNIGVSTTNFFRMF